MSVFTATLRADLLLGDVASLKVKRGVVRSLVAGLRRLDLAVAETGHQDLLRRTEIGVAAVAGTHAHAVEVLDAAERWLWSRPEVEVVRLHRTVRSDDD